jgi:CSLREA domain-containing protein
MRTFTILRLVAATAVVSSLVVGIAPGARAADPPPAEEPPEYTFPGVEPETCSRLVTSPTANPPSCMYDWRGDEIDLEISTHNIGEGDTFTMKVVEKKAGGYAPTSYGWDLHLFHMGWGTSSGYVNENQIVMRRPGGFPNRPSSLFWAGPKITKLSPCRTTDTECTFRLDKTWVTSQKKLSVAWVYVGVAIDGPAHSGSHPYYQETYLGITPKYSEEPEPKIAWRPTPGSDGWEIELDASGSTDDGEIKQTIWTQGSWNLLSDKEKWVYKYDPPCRYYTVEEDGEPPCETAEFGVTLGVTDDLGLSAWVDETITFPVTPEQCSPGPCPIIVNDTGDGADSSPGDDSCDIDPNSSGEQCTLRAAIEEANSDSTRDTIVFALPTSPAIIAPATPLPAITQPVGIEGAGVRIDGSASDALTGAGFTVRAPNVSLTGFEIGGFSAGIALEGGGGTKVIGNYIGITAAGATIPNATGILVSSANNEISGNVVSANLGDGMRLSGDGNRVVSNIVGLSPDGVYEAGNGRYGITLGSLGNFIGEPGAGNVIVSNKFDGIHVLDGGNTIRANWIGVDPRGLIVKGAYQGTNGEAGIYIMSGANNMTIGGPAPADGNVIAQNGTWGISAWADGLRVENNHIGMVPGSSLLHAWPNVYGGVLVIGRNGVVSGNTFGLALRGPSVGLFNAVNATIQRNQFNADPSAIHATGISTGLVGGAGAGNEFVNGSVVVTGSAKMRIRTNTHRFNPSSGAPPIEIIPGATGGALDSAGSFGFSFEHDFVTPNDSGDGDTGPNGVQNFPVLTQAVTSNTNVIVTGTIDGSNVARSIDLYSTPACHQTGHGPGERYLATVNVPAGQTTFTRSIPWILNDPSLITATATGPDGTSEFSACIGVNSGAKVARYSTSSARTGSKLLGGAKVKGKIAVFADATQVKIPAGSSVKFFIDNKLIGSDVTAPFDMNGTAANGTATLYDTAKLSVGTHQLMVRIVPTSGPTISLLPVAFTVTRA